MQIKNNPPLLTETIELCARHDIRPSRSKGQNFLIEESAYDALVEASGIGPESTVLEVGPGLGFLTERLAARAQKVITVELDDKLAAVLTKRFRKEGRDNVEIFNEDVMNFTGRWAEAVRTAGAFSVAANLPYNISSIFLRKFVSGNEGGLLPERLTLMLQKEVAERLVAAPGAMSVLAVSVQFYARPEIIRFVPAKSFWPAPQVGSAIISIVRDDIYKKRLADLGISETVLFRIVKIGFSARRKMLKANLAAGLHIPAAESIRRLEEAGVGSSVRAQELSLDDWLKTVVAFREFVV